MPTQIRGDQIQSESVTGDNILNSSITTDDLSPSLIAEIYKVKVNSGDSSADYLANKIVSGEGISISTGSTITISSTGSGGGGGGGSGSSGPINTIPTAADFPTTVLGNGSVTDTSSALILKANGHGSSFDVQQILQTAPSSPWSKYYKFEINPVQKQFLNGGFLIKRSSTGEFVYWSVVHTGASLDVQYSQYTNATTRSSFTSSVPVDPTGIYFRIEDDGTNFILSASPAGEAGTYVAVHSVSRTAFLASYDLIGFGVDALNSISPDRDCILAIQHYDSSAPSFATGSGTTSTIWNPKAPPASPNAKDDEFDDGTLDAKWTEYDPPGILTVTENDYGLKLVVTDDGGSSNSVVGIRQSIPTSDEWEIVTRVTVGGVLAGYMLGGLYISGDIATNPTTAPFLCAYLYLSTGGHTAVEIVNMSNRTTWYSTAASVEIRSDTLYLAMQYKASTNTACIWFSHTGVDWVRLSSASYAPMTITAATHFGIYANGIDVAGSVMSEFFRVREASSGILNNSPSIVGARVTVSGSSSTGVSAHDNLTALSWTGSGHTGTASTLAGFNSSGIATTHALSSFIATLLDDTDAATARATLGAISGATISVNTQSGTSGTYTKPAGAVVAIIDLWGGSGGGGGGSRQDGAVAATGGASGQTGEWLRAIADPSSIDGLSWSGGAGGTAGAGRTGSTGNGSGGGAGSDSTFGGRTAAGGSGGGGGSATGNSLGGGLNSPGAGNPAAASPLAAYRIGGGSIVTGKARGFGTVGVGMTAGSSPISGMDATGGCGSSGGHGGGLTTTASGAGGNGGSQGSTTGGNGGAATGANGDPGTTPASAWLPGSAGGGGGANNSGAGGTGGTPGRGCSGAGGGAGRNGNGGDGSAGADGGCVIRTICITTTG